jgi:hypothetical protein
LDFYNGLNGITSKHSKKKKKTSAPTVVEGAEVHGGVFLLAILSAGLAAGFAAASMTTTLASFVDIRMAASQQAHSPSSLLR